MTTDAPAPTGDTGQQPPQQTGPATDQQPTQTPAAAPAGDTDDLAQLDQAALAKMVRDLRRENGTARTAAKASAAEKARQELAQEIGRAIGLVKDDGDKADPNTLAEQLQSERRERYAEKAARTAKLDPDRLLDSRRFTRELAQLDPAAADFTDALEALVQSYTDDPRFKTSSAGQAPARSSGDFSGGPGTAPRFTREQIARMTPAEYAQNRDAIMAQLGQKK